MKDESGTSATARVRGYEPQDREQLRRLVLELHETLRPLDATLAPGDRIIDAYFEHLLATQARTDGTIFVAEHNARLVGYICLFGRVRPEDPDEIDEPHAYMADLYVCPEFRRKGVGVGLVARGEEFARRLGVRTIELKVLAANHEAREFYRRLGYGDRVVVMSKRLLPL